MGNGDSAYASKYVSSSRIKPSFLGLSNYYQGQGMVMGINTYIYIYWELMI